jgi:hypothetical protein
MRAALALVLLLAAPAAAQDRLQETGVRAFVQRQERAWNAGDLEAYFAAFDRRAVFVDQALSNENTIVPYGRSTLAEAMTQARRALGRSKVTEAGQVRAVAISLNGKGAAVAADLTTRIEHEGRVRTTCAKRLLTLARIGGRLRALSQTDTVVRCRAAP